MESKPTAAAIVTKPADSKPAGTELEGVIIRVFRSYPGWSAGLIKTTSGDTVRFSGKIFATPEQSVVLVGEWSEDSKYGTSFSVKSTKTTLEINLAGLGRYLSEDPGFKGIGDVKAKEITQKIGHDFEELLLDRPLEFMALSQLNEKTKNNLKQAWLKNRPFNEIKSWLYSYGLTPYLVDQLVKLFGNSCLDVLQDDPYVLLDDKYPGFGFWRVDGIARKMDISADHPSRLKAVLKHVVSEERLDGHCWIPLAELVSKANRLLEDPQDSFMLISQEQMTDTLKVLFRESLLAWNIPKELSDADGTFEEALQSGELQIGLADIKNQESDLARLFKKPNLQNPNTSQALKLACQKVQENPGLNSEQKLAVNMALTKGLCLISGVAGSGKTHIISEISEISRQVGLQVTLAAPTGKAARRMEETSGLEAKTIHRLLKWNGNKFDNKLGNKFAVNRQKPLKTDVLIVDEFSMVDVDLAWHLFEAVDFSKTAMLLVGDHNQLPPVGPGNVLRDLIRSETLPTVILDKVVRQAGDLPIKCAEILEGNVPESTPPDSNNTVAWAVKNGLETPEEVIDYLMELHETRLEARGFNILKDVQVLTPQNDGPLGTKTLNRRLQKLIQKKLWGIEVDLAAEQSELLKNDKVIQTKNNYNLGENGIMNGTIGTVESRTAKGALSVNFDGEIVKISPKDKKDIQLAYALTIHKSQGSEFPCVILVVHDNHSRMHHRNLFYTGVTRAKTTALTVGNSRGIQRCAQEIETDRRRTFLSHLL